MLEAVERERNRDFGLGKELTGEIERVKEKEEKDKQMNDYYDSNRTYDHVGRLNEQNNLDKFLADLDQN